MASSSSRIAAAAALKLHGFPGSSTTNRCRIALLIKEIPFQMETVNLGAGEQATEEFSHSKNPLNQIPLLELEDGTLLKQSVAIMEYLEEAYPTTKRLLPQDPIDRARCRQIVEIVNSFIQPMQNKLTVEKVAELDPAFAEWLPKAVRAHLEGTTFEGKDGEVNFWPQFWMKKGFRALEEAIDSAGPYCMGKEVTLADCAVVPQVIGARLYRLDMKSYPKVSRVFDSVASRPEIKAGLADILSHL